MEIETLQRTEQREWDSLICKDKREEEGRLGRRQEKEELKEDLASSNNLKSNHVTCTLVDRSKNKLL